jgi:hypothetical protein
VTVRSSRPGRIAGNYHTALVVAGERAVNRQPLFEWGAPPSARARGGTALRSALPVLKNPANRSRAVSLTAEQFRYAFGNAVTELVELDDRGHSLVIDSGWPDVADACLKWLREHGL